MEAGKKTEHSRREVERLVGKEIILKDFLLLTAFTQVFLGTNKLLVLEKSSSF